MLWVLILYNRQSPRLRQFYLSTHNTGFMENILIRIALFQAILLSSHNIGGNLTLIKLFPFVDIARTKWGAILDSILISHFRRFY